MAKSFPYKRVTLTHGLSFEIGIDDVAAIHMGAALGPFIFIFIKYAEEGDDERDRTFMVDPAAVVIECGQAVDVTEPVKLELPRLELPGGRAVI